MGKGAGERQEGEHSGQHVGVEKVPKRDVFGLSAPPSGGSPRAAPYGSPHHEVVQWSNSSEGLQKRN